MSSNLVYPTSAFCIARDYAMNGTRPTGYKKGRVTTETKTKWKSLSCIAHKSRFQMDKRPKCDKAKLEMFRKNRRVLLY